MIVDDILETFSGDGKEADEGQHARITEDKNFVKNEELEAQKEYKQDQSNDKSSSDPSAQRNTGANAYTQRSNQKDQLENLHIGGSETEPQGGNEHRDQGEQAQGPGFEAEGSYELGNAIRTQDQDFGEDAPSGPARSAAGITKTQPAEPGDVKEFKP